MTDHLQELIDHWTAAAAKLREPNMLNWLSEKGVEHSMVQAMSLEQCARALQTKIIIINHEAREKESQYRKECSGES